MNRRELLALGGAASVAGAAWALSGGTTAAHAQPASAPEATG
jgi:hypothetical protein